MDRFEGSYDKSISRAARAAVKDVLAVRKGERILVITNPGKEVRELSMAVHDSALDVGAEPTIIFQGEKGQFDFAEEEVIKAMSAGAPIMISLSSDKLGKDRFGMTHGYKGKRRYDHIFDKLYEEKKIRGFWSPSTTKDMFRRTVPIDYRRLRSDCAKVAKSLEGADSVRVTAPGGTDVTIGLKGRKARSDDGDFRRPGLAGNLPSGEVYVSPALGTMNGTIAFDGSIVLHKGEIVIRRPIMAEVRGGFVRSISGGSEAAKLEESVKLGETKAREKGRKGELKSSLVEEYARNARSIGELGIGLNRSARITANMLEDEKVYGTCHFAIGANYDGDAEAMIHMDGIVKKPTIVVRRSGKDRPLMVGGRLVWD